MSARFRLDKCDASKMVRSVLISASAAAAATLVDLIPQVSLDRDSIVIVAALGWMANTIKLLLRKGGYDADGQRHDGEVDAKSPSGDE